MFAAILAAALLEASHSGVNLKIEAQDPKIDPGKSMSIVLTLETPAGVEAAPPDLRPRLRGFSKADNFAEEPVEGEGGAKSVSVEWLLSPEPCAKAYKIAPFVVDVKGGESFVAGPVRFDPPDEIRSPGGEMQIDPKKDLPPFSWLLLGEIALGVLAAAAVAAGAFLLLRRMMRRVVEHFKSPIERAWAELDRLVKKGLPMRGRYKDFYVELTMVVRRYIKRKYGVKAPNLTTEEFFSKIESSGVAVTSVPELRQFLENADLVKFAGVEASVAMADNATESARDYLKRDSSQAAPGGKGKDR